MMSNFDEKSYVRNGHLNTPSGLNVVICNVILQEQQIQYPFVYRDFIGIHISIVRVNYYHVKQMYTCLLSGG